MLPETDFDRTRLILAARFGDLAVVLLLITAITVLISLLPFQFQDLAWQNDAIATLIAIAPLAVAALGLLHLGSYYSPGSPSLTGRRTLCCRLAIVVVVGYLLLVPLQLGVSLQQYQAAHRRQQQNITSMAQLEDIRRQVQAATNITQLQDAIPLQGPLSVQGVSWSQPLAEIRREIATRITLAQVEGNRPAEQIGTGSNNGPGQGRRRGRRRGGAVTEANSFEVRLWIHTQRALLRVSQLLLWAAAFALMAQRPGSDLPVLVEWTEGLNRPRRTRE